MNEIIIAILSSSVLATIISVLFNIFKSDKDNYLNYITAERSKWRADLREVIELLPTDDVSKVKRLLGKLESYMYPYGKNSGSDNYMEDGHIWCLLKSINVTIEAKSNDYEKVLISETSQLKEYLLFCLNMIGKEVKERLG